MPRGDGTGPRGFGPMTGRAAGFCTGFGVPGHVNPGAEGGYYAGRGRGGGRGFRNRFYATGLTGWQREGGYIPPWGNPFAYTGPYNSPTMPVVGKQQEIDNLKAQAHYLEDALENIRTQLKELEERQKNAEMA